MKLVTLLILMVFITACTEQPSYEFVGNTIIADTVYVTDTIVVKDTVYIAKPETTVVSPDTFILNTIIRDTVVRYIDTTFVHSKSSTGMYSWESGDTTFFSNAPKGSF